MKFTKHDIEVNRAYRLFRNITEADIRNAHGEVVPRPKLIEFPDDIYGEVVRLCEGTEAYQQMMIDEKISWEKKITDSENEY